jgi:hypothetical protein
VTGGRVDGNIQIVQGYVSRSARRHGHRRHSGIWRDIQIEKMSTGRVIITDARVNNGNIQVVENSDSVRPWRSP